VALTHLLDTSVLTRLSRPEVLATVEPLAVHGLAARAGISDLEIGFSARNDDEWNRLIGALDAFVLVETTTAHVHRARQVQRLLASRQQRGRKIPDLLVAAAAETLSLTVVHYDADFDFISDATGQPCQWVVERGSID